MTKGKKKSSGRTKPVRSVLAGSVGRVLNGRRSEEGLTYGALAERSDVSVSSIWGLLRGHDPNPRFATIEAVAVALGFRVSDLMRTAEGMAGEPAGAARDSGDS